MISPTNTEVYTNTNSYYSSDNAGFISRPESCSKAYCKRSGYSLRSIFRSVFRRSFFTFFSVHLPPDFLRSRMLNPSEAKSLIISKPEANILEGVINFSGQTNWILTDLPMYAYRTQKPVPPNLAAITVKRLLTHNLTQDEIIQTIKKYQPEQVLVGRMQYDLVEIYLREQYSLLRKEDIEGNITKLYIRNDLLDGP